VDRESLVQHLAFSSPSRARAHLASCWERVADISSLFSGEESLGRFLDVYLYHSQYINIKGVSRSASPPSFPSLSPPFSLSSVVKAYFRTLSLLNRIPYLAFLDLLSKGTPDANIAKKEKGSQAYLEFVSSPLTSLPSFPLELTLSLRPSCWCSSLQVHPIPPHLPPLLPLAHKTPQGHHRSQGSG